MTQWRPVLVFSMFIAGAVAFAGDAVAQTLKIVALGASNTSGHGRGRTAGGVNTPEAYPAQLEKLLRARGLDARVTNAGIAGDTTTGMLARVNSDVPNGTDIVILQPGGNDARRGQGGGKSSNVAQIRSILQQRGIKVIMLQRMYDMAPISSRDPDGQHLDARGHAAVAARLVPQVMAAAKQGKAKAGSKGR